MTCNIPKVALPPTTEQAQSNTVAPSNEKNSEVESSRELPVVTFAIDKVNEAVHNTAMDGCNVDEPGQPISSLAYEPLDRLRQMREQIARQGGSLLEESTIQAVMQVREMFANCDDDSIDSK